MKYLIGYLEFFVCYENKENVFLILLYLLFICEI